MFGLPETVKIPPMQLHKKILVRERDFLSKEKQLIDTQISRLSIIAEISPEKANIMPSDELGNFFLVSLALRSQKCDDKSIEILSKKIEQKMLFVLLLGSEGRFAAYRAGSAYFSEQMLLENLCLKLVGNDTKSVYENLVRQVAGLPFSETPLDTQLQQLEQKKRIEQKITALEHKAYAEPQPRRKLELFEELGRLKKELEEL
jgi:hypothetical protein